MKPFAIWMLLVEASNESGGGMRTLYAITDGPESIPNPDAVIEIALPGEVIYRVMRISLLHEFFPAASTCNPNDPISLFAEALRKEGNIA